MARFFWKLSWFLRLLVLMATVSYRGDAAGLFHTDALLPGIAAHLARGEGVEVPGNFDERQLQLQWIGRLSRVPARIVLGSSRADTISGDLCNHFVSGATLPDLVAVWELYRERGWAPSQVLLEVDPWTFNRKNREGRWRSLSAQYQRALERLGGHPEGATFTQLSYWWSRWGELLSPSYFQDSLARLDSGPGGSAWRRGDGSLRIEAPSARVAAENARSWLQRPYGLAGYRELDPGLRATFEALLQEMKAQGSAVTLVLAPYHPIAWQGLRQDRNYRMVEECERYLRTLGLPVLGSFAPQPGDRFLDGQHPLETTMRRIVP